MKSLQQLITDLCPDGVEYKRLGELLSYEQPGKYIISSKDYLAKGIPVLTAGQSFILGYVDEPEGIYTASPDNPVIIFDDFTTSFHWVDFDFKVKSSAMKMLKPQTTQANFRFLFYAMKCIKYDVGEHARQWISKYSQLEVPVPPMEVQERIVEILDKMTALAAELQAELQARQAQYEYYRNRLLAFGSVGGSDNIHSELADTQQLTLPSWQLLKMSELGEFRRGNGLQKKDFVDEGVGCIHYGQIYTYYRTFATNTKSFVTPELAQKLVKAKPGDIIITTTSENVEDVCKCVAWLGSEEIVIGGHECVFSTTQNPKYIAYYLQTKDFFNQKKRAASGVKVIDVKIYDLMDFLIPVPPLEEQQRIVDILDRFEALTSDLTAGLPAEIAARQQQYEYYRNLLLTFKRKSA